MCKNSGRYSTGFAFHFFEIVNIESWTTFIKIKENFNYITFIGV